MPRPFLTARWSHLCLLTYSIPHDLLTPRLPPGCELDTRDGQAFASLVFFDFLDTRVLGVPWPGYRDFPEINLRFYVRRGEERGVVFVRELVPLRLVAWAAKLLYNEPYAYAPMTSQVTASDEALTVRHALTWGGRQHTLELEADPSPRQEPPDSTAHFFKEHEWGYGTDRRGRCLKYQVVHPVWETFPVRRFALDFDSAQVYGPGWEVLADAEPVSVVLAKGSAIEVHPGASL